ncbi:MAG TPA: immunoglobulin domain-containing protein, partial [Candidatus Sulfotelmatobacter sp.]|nr:immunoglobulin domain-containing protein [Candidatus Sulfotelmatobacter sp.]
LNLAKVGGEDVASYSVLVSNAFGCVTSLVATLTVNYLPALTSQPGSVTTNAGCAVAFAVTTTGTPPLRYQWFHNRTNRLRDDQRISGATSSTLSRSDVSDPDQGCYQAVVENDYGAVTSAVATLTVIHPPRLLSQPANVMTSAGGSVTFSVAAGGTLPLAYQWLKQDGQSLTDAANLSGSTSPSLTLSNVLGGDAGAYRVVVTNAAGNLTSSPAVLVVVDPILTGQPVSLVQNAGTTARFTVQAYGTAPSYSWYKNGAALMDQDRISGSATPTLCLSNISDPDVAGYRAVVRNAFGSVTSAVVSLTVINPPLITRPPGSRTNVAGTTASFVVTVSGTAPFTYQWFKATSPISGATEATLTLPGVSDADAGAYSVSVANAAGTVTSPPATLTIIHPPLILRQPASQTNLAGTTVTFTGQASGTAPLGYQWRFGDNNLSEGGQFSGVTTPTLSIFSLHPTNAGEYSLVVTNPAGSVLSQTATLAVSVLSLPAPTGLIGWWPGDGDARDIFSTNHGTLKGATADAVGVVGQAFRFDGTNDYVQIADAPALRPTNLTVEAWVRFAAEQTPGNTADPRQQYLIFRQNTRSSSFEGFALSKEGFPQGDLLVWEMSSAAGINVSVTSVSPVVTGVWYHVAAVRGPDFIQLYVNGKLEGAADIDFAQSYGNHPLYFGSSGQTYYDRKFQGELDEVSLYGRALSANEIAAIYAAGALGKTKTGGTLSILTQPLSQSVMPGATVRLHLAASGALPLHCQWRFNEGNLTDDGQFSGTTTPTLFIAGFQAANVGTYSALVWNMAGSLTSASATLLLGPGGLISLYQQDGELRFTLVGEIGRSYTVETSADLVQWSELRTITLSGGTAQLSEPMTGTMQFFRVRLLP